MKKIKLNVLTALTLIIVSSVFYSCTNENSEINDVQESISAKQLEFIGIEHNQMLTETFNFLKDNKSSLSKKSGKQKKQLLEDFLVSKISSNSKYTKQSNEIGIGYTKDIFNKLNSNLNNNSRLNLQKEAGDLSEKEVSYLNKLQKILVLDIELNEVLERISNLEGDIQNEESLNDEQLILLFSATQTAKYSYSYWAENWQEWIELSPEAERISKVEDDGHNGCSCETAGVIAGADVAGAIGGATGAWAVNVIPGAGQVAYGGAIIGAAVAASTAAAVLEFFSWWND